MGAVLLTAGAKGKRTALPHSRVMIHQPLAGTEGTTTEILIHAREFIRLKRDLNEILLRHTGQTLEKIERDTDRDKFMSAKEAQEYGIVDNVLERLDREPVAAQANLSRVGIRGKSGQGRGAHAPPVRTVRPWSARKGMDSHAQGSGFPTRSGFPPPGARLP